MQQSSTWFEIKYFIQTHGVYFSPLIPLLVVSLLSVQVDFRAFYIAGCVTLAHADPYLNYNFFHSFSHGVSPTYFFPSDFFREGSRFLYSPLTAMLFGVLAYVPYTAAKMIFTILVMLAYILSLSLLNRFKAFDIDGRAIVLLSASLVMLCVFTQGQIDLIVLCLVVLAMSFLENQRSVLCAAFCYAFAIIIKIFPIFFYGFSYTSDNIVLSV